MDGVLAGLRWFCEVCVLSNEAPIIKLLVALISTAENSLDMMSLHPMVILMSNLSEVYLKNSVKVLGFLQHLKNCTLSVFLVRVRSLIFFPLN